MFAPALPQRGWPVIWAGQRKRWMLLLVGNGLLQAALACAAGLLVHAVVQRTGAQVANGETAALYVGVMACAIGMLVLRAIERRDAQRLGQHYSGEIRTAMWSHLLGVAPDSLARSTRGTLTLRLTGDLRALRLWVSLGVARTVVCAAVGSACMLALLWVHPMLAVAVGLAAGSVLAAGTWWGRKHTRITVRQERRAHARLHAFVNERVHQLGWLVGAGMHRREHARLARLDAQHTEAAVALAWRLALVRHCGDAAVAAAGVALLVVGLGLLPHGGFSLAQLTALITMLGFAAPALREQGLALAHLQGAAVSRERVQVFFKLGQALPTAHPAPAQDSGLVLLAQVNDSRWQHYLGAGELRIAPGHVLRLALDPSPSARDLLNACQGLAPWPQGELRLCVERKQVALFDAAAPMWRGSLRYNLLYLAPRVKDQQVEALLFSLGLDRWVAGQPRGLRLRVHEGGHNLPIGVRQRLALGRALLAEPKLLLIDETLTPMDSATRAQVDQALYPYRARGMAVLWAQASARAPVSPSQDDAPIPCHEDSDD